MKLIDRFFLWWLERRTLTVHLQSDGLDVELTVGGVPVFASVEYLPGGHWHQRQIGPEDDQGMALFEADWISGAAVCEDCSVI
jgi:hypothetical protein